MPTRRDAFSEQECRIIVRMAREVVCEAHGISHAQLHARLRGGARLAQARQMAMYLAHVIGQLSLAEVAATFGRDRSTVSHACINIEDRRDSPIFNLQMEYLEKCLRERIQDYHCRTLAAASPVRERKSALQH